MCTLSRNATTKVTLASSPLSAAMEWQKEGSHLP